MITVQLDARLTDAEYRTQPRYVQDWYRFFLWIGRERLWFREAKDRDAEWEQRGRLAFTKGQSVR